MNSVEGASPRVILCTAGKKISTAYLVADEGVRIKIENPSVDKTLMCLLASYFTWDVAYPLAYVNAMEYLESEIVRPVAKIKPSVQKFIRDTELKMNALAKHNASISETSEN